MAGFAIAAAALMTAATAAKIGAGFQQAGAQADLLKFREREFETRAQLSEDVTEANIQNLKRQQRFRRGSIAARFGASGVRVDKGSPLDVLVEQAKLDALQRANVRFQGQIRARDFRTGARVSGFQRQQVRRGAVIGAFGQTLNLGAQFAAGGGIDFGKVI